MNRVCEDTGFQARDCFCDACQLRREIDMLEERLDEIAWRLPDDHEKNSIQVNLQRLRGLQA